MPEMSTRSSLRELFSTPVFGIIDRYLFGHVVMASIAVVLVLGALDLFFIFLSELDAVGKGNYGYPEVFVYLLYHAPRRIYSYAPTAVLLGGLISLGGMAGRGELVAIRAAGKSIVGIVGSVLKAGVALAVMTFLLGEYVAPDSDQVAEKTRSRAISSQQAVSSGGELWVRDGNNFVHARGVLDGSRLVGVTVYRFEDLALREIVSAASAEVTQGGDWLLSNVKRLTLEDEQIQRRQLPTDHWEHLVDEGLFSVLNVTPAEMSAQSLESYIGYLDKNELDSSAYRLAFWNRFIHPLSVLVMLLLAAPFVFSSQRTGGAGQQIFIGVMLGIGYFLASQLFNQMGLVYGISPFLSAALPPLLFLLLGLFLLRRVI